MWFTRVSLQNPVFATMVMLALVVLGLFSYQRLQIDQFPNIDLPVVVVITDYPGAAPEIVESEVTKKVEEGVNSIAGINALTSRTTEGQSVVILEFGLHIDGARRPRTCARKWPRSSRCCAPRSRSRGCCASTRRRARSGRSRWCPTRRRPSAAIPYRPWS
jgi:hypothetical protein